MSQSHSRQGDGIRHEHQKERINGATIQSPPHCLTQSKVFYCLNPKGPREKKRTEERCQNYFGNQKVNGCVMQTKAAVFHSLLS